MRSWKCPIALAAVACSLIPTTLLHCIDYLELHGSAWSHNNKHLPFISWTFSAHYQLGWLLPILTAAVTIWFLTGKGVTPNRLAWALFCLVILHLFWFSYATLAFYLANQSFIA
jgi:hypothetical protein